MKHYPPVGEAQGKKKEVEEMFDAIAPRYDVLNRILSAGIDRGWRKKAVDWLGEDRPKRILDIATGTADLALESARLQPERIVGVDIAEEMLKLGREKIAQRQLSDLVTLQRGDAERLPFSDSQFDGALVAFGVRNFESLDKGLKDIFRVLKNDGSLVILEFSQPGYFPVKQAYGLYMKYILPTVGRWFSRNDGAYKYLPDSIAVFPHGRAFMDVMEQCGYSDVEQKKLSFGIASLYKGRVKKG